MLERFFRAATSLSPTAKPWTRPPCVLATGLRERLESLLAAARCIDLRSGIHGEQSWLPRRGAATPGSHKAVARVAAVALLRGAGRVGPSAGFRLSSSRRRLDIPMAPLPLWRPLPSLLSMPTCEEYRT